MSKLLDRLDTVTRGPTRTLGFTPAANRETVPTLALLAWVNDPAPSMVEAGADAIILPSADGLKSKVKPLGGVTWGVAVRNLDRDQVESHQGMGCDFLVFGIENTRVDALEEGECTRVLRIPSDLDDTLIRGVEDLPVDIVLVNRPEPEGPLSLAHMLAISNVRSATTRYLLVEWDGELTDRELEHLRDIGVDGVVVTSADAAATTVSTLRKRIDGLAPRRPRSDQRGAAVLPRIGTGAGVRPQRTEEEDEEEWDEP